MKQILDARGKNCPIPVIETQKALGKLQADDMLEVAVDNQIAVQNLTKMANQKKLPVSAATISENHYVVTFTMSGSETVISGEKPDVAICVPTGTQNNIVVALASDEMGIGDEKLGHILMKGFVYALTEREQLPRAVLLYNRGAFLSVEGSGSLADLKLLETQGVEILTCGTCLNHFGLSDKLGVGSATNMYAIAEKMMQASLIVKP
jgi:selenium metabolism protein YedF